MGVINFVSKYNKDCGSIVLSVIPLQTNSSRPSFNNNTSSRHLKHNNDFGSFVFFNFQQLNFFNPSFNYGGGSSHSKIYKDFGNDGDNYVPRQYNSSNPSLSYILER